MKTLSSAFQTHLDSGATTLATCWRITRTDGQVFGFTDHDFPLSFDGTSFAPETGLSPADLSNAADLSVDAQECEGVLSSGTITEADLLDGLWDAALVEIWRVNWADTSQRVLLRRGTIGQVRRGPMAFVAEMRSLAHILNQTGGRSFQYACDATLGDARCGVDLSLSTWKGTGSVASVIRDRVFVASGLSGFADGFFSAGVLSWTSGANAGRRAEVVRHVQASGSDEITLLAAPIEGISASDAFAITAGCDKSATTCADKFANIDNFRGFPDIPGNDTIFRFARQSNANDGAVL